LNGKPGRRQEIFLVRYLLRECFTAFKETLPKMQAKTPARDHVQVMDAGRGRLVFEARMLI
jgi:hypothetical protein